MVPIEQTVTPEQIKFTLINLLDQLMMISNQKAWSELATPELETQHRQAVDAVDALWWEWRNHIGSSVD